MPDPVENARSDRTTWLRVPAAAVVTISAATCYLLVLLMLAGDWTRFGYLLIAVVLVANASLLLVAGECLLDDESPSRVEGPSTVPADTSHSDGDSGG